jgi:hypothetical protein
MHVDVMDTIAGYGASRWVGLGMWGPTLGLAGKGFIDGEVYEHMLAGELALVHEYCKLDTLMTMLAFLAWAHHTGDVTTRDLLRHVDAIRTSVGQLHHEGWRPVERGLEHWPPWAKRAESD